MDQSSSQSNRHRKLPRLTPAWYRGFAFVHWTMTIHERATGWITPSFHAGFQLIHLHALARYQLVCPVYCVMPDHFHLLWLGVSPSSDQRLAAAFLRKYLAHLLVPDRFQTQAYDHVLREQEREHGALQATAVYILNNPVRTGLVSTWSEYAYSGCMIPGYPKMQIQMPDYWDKFWRVYAFVCDQNERGPRNNGR